MKMYFANGLFSEADREFNRKTVKKIRSCNEDFKVYLPQENMSINDKSKVVSSQDIANGDMEQLINSDVLIAVLDGVEIDSGVAAEIGAFYMTDKPIFALCTDIRLNSSDKVDKFENPTLYRNLMVVGLIKNSGGCVCDSENELLLNVNNYALQRDVK